MTSFSPRPDAPAVLIVEDEPILMMNAVDIVEEAGYRVFEAAHAAQAIEILEARDDIVLVFTDVQLAGTMDGLRLARLVRERWPPIKLIVSSGRIVVPENELPAASSFLPKPYRAEEVHRLLETLLKGDGNP